jgi:hypothetical protein
MYTHPRSLPCRTPRHAGQLTARAPTSALRTLVTWSTSGNELRGCRGQFSNRTWQVSIALVADDVVKLLQQECTNRRVKVGVSAFAIASSQTCDPYSGNFAVQAAFEK